MPGFPDKFMPFYGTSRRAPGCSHDRKPPCTGPRIRALRGFTARTADEEPKWRRKSDELLTGYKQTW